MDPIPAARCIGARELTEPRLSPDGRWVAFAASGRGGASIQLVPIEGGAERQLTVSPPTRPGRGLGGGCFDWTPDSAAVVYTGADGQLWLQSLRGGAARCLTASDGPAMAPAVSPDGRHVAYVVDMASVWIVPLDGPIETPAIETRAIDVPAEASTVGGPTGVRTIGGLAEARLVDDAADFCTDPAWSPDGTTLAWHEWNVPAMPWDRSTLALATPFGGGKVRRVQASMQMQQPRFLADGHLAHLADGSGWLNVAVDGAPLVDEAFEHGGPTWGPGQRSFAGSADGRRIAFCRNEGGFGRLCVVRREDGDVQEVAKAVHGQLSWRGDTLVAIRTGGRTPTQIVAYDTAGTDWARRQLVVGAYAGWEDHPALVEPQLVEAHADDGTVLHARWYPAPEPNGATLCWVHGGPTDQWQVTWMPRLAFWLSRGCSILVPDHRGSTGHGRAYTQALHGGWGALDADDTATLLAGVQQRGDASPARTAMMGASAGGLTVLGVLARHPGLARCGITSYPVCDLAALAEATHRFEAHYNDTLIGTGEAAVRASAERSPVHLAARLAATPLLVFHGDADPVVPLAQSQLLAERVRAAGGDVDLVVYEGEGHGFRDPDHQLDEYARTQRFLARHLGVSLAV